MTCNVLLVIGDQWRAQALGYAGNDEVQTPHIDAFAADAVDCHRAISGCPVCTPARATLITGLRPDRHGLFLNDAPLDPDLPSLAKQCRAAGYDTGFVGKWHIDGHGRKAFIPSERRQGFDYWKVLECTHEYNASEYYAGDDEAMRVWEDYDAIAQTDDMIAWLTERDGARPFCGVLSWGPPHNPYHTAPERYRAMYAEAEITVPANVPAAMVEDARRDLRGYYAHCTALDDCFGRLLACLKDQGVYENTVIIFTSDHGDFIGAHGLYDKQGPWDEAIRVPFLIKAPGLPAGTRNETIIDWVDIWPTINGLLDLPQPEQVQGRNMAGHLQAGSAPAANWGLYGCYHCFGNWPRHSAKAEPLYRAREARGLRDERYTYCIDLNGPWLLYDNELDPLQMHNLVDSPAHAALRETLDHKLRDHLAAEHDEFLPGMTYVERWGYEVGDNGTITTAAFK